MSDPAADHIDVHITIAARPATVFRHFTDPAAFARWMGQGSVLDATPGGHLRVVYPNGDVAVGRVEQVTPNERIVFTWGYESGAHGLAPGASRVEVVLTPVAEGTRVHLRHSGLRHPAQRDNHRAGWRYYLARLAQDASADLDVVATAAVDAYLAAWSATDPRERDRLLHDCWESNGVFRDRMGYAEGVRDLSDYIATVQRFAAGMRLERAGPLARSHGFGSYRWRITGPDGSVMMTGTNTVEFTPEGRLRSTTGFTDVAGA